MIPIRVLLLFAATAGAEIFGCYLVFLYVQLSRPWWLLLPAAASLGLFAWLLALHPTAAGRTYAAYGGVYVAAAVLWLWSVEHQRPDRWDILGALTSVVGMLIIYFGPRGK